MKNCRANTKTKKKRGKKGEEKRNGSRWQTNKLIYANIVFFMENMLRCILATRISRMHRPKMAEWLTAPHHALAYFFYLLKYLNDPTSTH
jgi:hypothetical protein